MRKIFIFWISLFATTTAFADPFPFTNFYLDGFFGINFVSSPTRYGARIDLHPGYVVGGTVGYQFSNYFSVEGEVAYRSNEFEQLVIDWVQVCATGENTKVTAMVNGLFEFPLIEDVFFPYCGLGIGKYWDKDDLGIDLRIQQGRVDCKLPPVNNSGLAYQGIIGLTLIVSEKIESAFEYRYLNGVDTTGNHTFDLKIKRYF